MKKLTAILTSLIMTLSVICQTSVFAAFSDVGDDNTYKDAITTLTKLKVIDGYEDGTFKPDGQITRAEFTKLIVFILGYKDLAYDSSDFTDVDASHWAKNYIQTAYNLGIIAGMGDGTFAPDAPVTYEQALKMQKKQNKWQNVMGVVNGVLGGITSVATGGLSSGGRWSRQ